MTLVEAFLPVCVLTTVGYLARRYWVLDDATAVHLGRFVFHLAMPAMLFRTMSGMSLSDLVNPSLVAFGASTALAICAGWLIARRFFGRTGGEGVIWGMTAGYVNAANVGIPVTQQLLGDISMIAVVLLWQLLVVSPLILLILDRQAGLAGRVQARQILTLPLRNPMLLAGLLGLAWSAVSLPIPSAVDGPLRLLGNAAVPTALVALGASMYGAPPADAPAPEISLIAGLKLLAQPLVALAVGLLLRLPEPQLLAVVVCAGLPTAQNSFVFAQRYGAGTALAGQAVLVTTVLSLGTLALAAMLLR